MRLTKEKMLYELTIAFSSIIVSFALYFAFFNLFHRRDEMGDNEPVQVDERRDLDGKELLLVTVVRNYDAVLVCPFIVPLSSVCVFVYDVLRNRLFACSFIYISHPAINLAIFWPHQLDSHSTETLVNYLS